MSRCRDAAADADMRIEHDFILYDEQGRDPELRAKNLGKLLDVLTNELSMRLPGVDIEFDDLHRWDGHELVQNGFIVQLDWSQLTTAKQNETTPALVIVILYACVCLSIP